MTTVSILIPVYNEEGNIRPLASYLELLKSDIDALIPGVDFRVVVCDNCSTDDTVQRVSQIFIGLFDTRIIRFAFNYGFHFSTSYLLSVCDSDIQVMIPADMQVPRDAVAKAVSKTLATNRSTFMCRSSNRQCQSPRFKGLAWTDPKRVFYYLLGILQSDTVAGYFGMGVYLYEDIRRLQLTRGEIFQPFQLRLVAPRIIYKPNKEYFDERKRAFGTTGFGKFKYIKEALSLLVRSSLISQRGLQLMIVASFALMCLFMFAIVVTKIVAPNVIMPGFATPIIVVLASSCLNILGMYVLWLKMDSARPSAFADRPVIRSDEIEISRKQ